MFFIIKKHKYTKVSDSGCRVIDEQAVADEQAIPKTTDIAKGFENYIFLYLEVKEKWLVYKIVDD